MTREEIIEYLDSIVGTYTILLGHGVNSDVLDTDDIEAINESIRIIKAIEDIKTEIDKLHKVGNANDGRVYVPINDVFDVIDKHINEVGTSKSLPEGSKE